MRAHDIKNNQDLFAHNRTKKPKPKASDPDNKDKGQYKE